MRKCDTASGVAHRLAPPDLGDHEASLYIADLLAAAAAGPVPGLAGPDAGVGRRPPGPWRLPRLLRWPPARSGS